MPSIYRDLIRETLARLGRLGMDPRHVEAWMRLEYKTLDALGGPRWNRAVREAAECVEAAPRGESESLALSYGLRPERGAGYLLSPIGANRQDGPARG